jgi:hypothetical protein
MRAKFSMVLMAVTLLFSSGSAQEGEASPGQTAASITVTTNIDSARLFIDSTFAGYTPTTVDTLSPGTYALRLVHPEVTSWLTSNVTDTVTLSPGEARSLRYTLREWYYLNSIPSGADIYINDSLAGATPMVLNASLFAPGASVSLAKEGYDPAAAGSTQFQRGSLILPLTRRAGMEPVNGSNIMQQMPASGNSLRLRVAGYSTLFFGAMTAYMKIRADKANEQFFRTQNPAYLSRRDRLDSQAIAAILITQICLGLFVYFLLSE